MPYSDKTTLNNLSPNLSPGQVAASGLRLAAFQYLYNLMDANYGELLALAAGIGRVVDGGFFTDTSFPSVIDGGTFV